MLVVDGVGDRELGDRGKVAELCPPPTHLLTDGRDPGLEEAGRGDVVVVHELALGALPEDVGHPAPDRELVEEYASSTRWIADALHRDPVVEPVSRGVPVVDVRRVPAGAQE